MQLAFALRKAGYPIDINIEKMHWLRCLLCPVSYQYHHIEVLMNISGIYINAWPTELSTVQQRLENVSGVEVHMATEEGGLVITVETDDSDLI